MKERKDGLAISLTSSASDVSATRTYVSNCNQKRQTAKERILNYLSNFKPNSHYLAFRFEVTTKLFNRVEVYCPCSSFLIILKTKWAQETDDVQPIENYVSVMNDLNSLQYTQQYFLEREKM